MSASIDFSKLSTWEKLDRDTICIRIAIVENSLHVGATRVCTQVFKMPTEASQRAQFFFNCEKMDLRGEKLFKVFKYHSDQDYSSFIHSVLSSDRAMLEFINNKEA